jgi:chemotaxis protein MotB
VEDRPIIIKRVKKVSGHHGGAWKVAFADFATAMMAFFLVLWLTAGTSPEVRQAVEGYFKDPVGFTEGGSKNPIDLGGSPSIEPAQSTEDEVEKMQMDEKTIKEVADNVELRRMEQILEDVKKQIEQSETLQAFRDQLLLDITEEGLRIQIVDRSNRPMFDSGSAQLKYYSEDILFELAKPLSRVPNKISITGHTDSTPFVGEAGYSNWELSADRANTARRALVAGAVDEGQVARVVGLADSVLFDQELPTAPVNRRIAIIVLNKDAADDIQKRAGSNDDVIDVSGYESSRPGPAEQARDSLKEGDWLDAAEKRQVDPSEVNW